MQSIHHLSVPKVGEHSGFLLMFQFIEVASQMGLTLKTQR